MVEICSWMPPALPGRPPGNTALRINDGSLIGLIPSSHKGSKPGPPGRTGITWQRVPGRQPDGLLQEGELGVVEPEGLIHHVGTGFHLHPQQRDGLPPADTESDLPREKQLSSRQGNASEGSAPNLRSSPHPELPLLPTWMCLVCRAPGCQEVVAASSPALSPAGPCRTQGSLSQDEAPLHITNISLAILPHSQNRPALCKKIKQRGMIKDTILCFLLETAQNGGKRSRLARWLALRRGGGSLPSLCSLDTVVLSSAQPPAYRHRCDSQLCRERLVSERDVDGLLGTQVDLGPKVITKVEHVLLQRCSRLRQLLEVPPLPRVQYDTEGARGRAVGESWIPSSLCSRSMAGGESAPNWGRPPA